MGWDQSARRGPETTAVSSPAWDWGLGLFFITAFSFIIPTAAFAVSQGESTKFARALLDISRWFSAWSEDYFGAVSVISAVLIAAAVATNLGRDAEGLPERIRRMLVVIGSVGAIAVAVIAAVNVSFALVDPAVWATVALKVLIALLVIQVAFLAQGVASAAMSSQRADAVWQRRESNVNQERQRRKSNADKDPITRGTVEDVRISVLLVWGLPAAIWLIVSIVAGVVVAAQGSDGLRAAVTIAFVYYGPFVLQIAWRCTADLSMPARARRAIRWALGGIAIVVSLSFAIRLWDALGYAPLVWLYLIFVLALGIGLFCRWPFEGVPFVRHIEKAVTVKALNQAWEFRVRQEERARLADPDRPRLLSI